MAISREIAFANTGDLLLDPKNPRLGRRNVEQELSQEQTLELMRNWELEELAVSFLENGFWPQEALVVVVDPEIDNDKFVVVEGNRRLAALRYLERTYAGDLKSRRWVEMVEQPPPGGLFDRIHILADSRDDVQRFLGFRHVTGIKEWKPAEKAEYISMLIDQGLSYVEVMRAIGSKTPTVRRNYIAYRTLLQIDALEDADARLVEERFSLLFLALRERPIQAFLGVDPDAEPADASLPVPTDHEPNLRDFVMWVFGDEEHPPLFTDSRLMGKFAQVLDSPEAVAYLQGARRPSLAIAASHAGADTAELLEHIQAATDELEQALSTLHLYVEESDIKNAVDRLTRGFAALMKIWPEARQILVAAGEEPA